jgi:hypothetical protein
LEQLTHTKAWGLVLLLVWYIVISSFILLNGLIGIFGHAFEMEEVDNTPPTRASSHDPLPHPQFPVHPYQAYNESFSRNGQSHRQSIERENEMVPIGTSQLSEILRTLRDLSDKVNSLEQSLSKGNGL